MIPIVIAAGMLLGSALQVSRDPKANFAMVKISAALLVLMIVLEIL